MKKYSKYKDSGIEWIGEIPKHWEVSRLKHDCYIYNGNSLKDELKVKYQSNCKDDTPYIGSKDITANTNKADYNNGIRIPKEDIKNFKLAKKGAVLLCNEGGSAGKKITFLHKDVCFVNKLSCIYNNSKYYYYFLQSNFFKKLFEQNLSGLISGVSISVLKNFDCLKTTYAEQETIANYLDKKTAEIDTLIEKKQQLIQLYKEERTATINQAVTKGLDPNVPMKDSGIEWLGEIPEHWEVKPLKYVGDCQNGISAGAEYFGSGYPFVSYGDVYKNEVLPESVKGLAKSNEVDQSRFSILKGDVLFTRTSETVDEIGIASTCFKTIDNATFAGFLIRFRPFEGLLHEGFSKYFFRSSIHRNYFVKEMNIVTRASLSQGLLKNLLVFLPSIEEQVRISNWIDAEAGKITSLMSKSEQEIELLKEYKTALISEVVLGKVDVREELTD